jgi:hypothetical protein
MSAEKFKRDAKLKENSRKKILEKMFEAALKEKFGQLARKYDPKLVFEIWTQIIRGGGVQGHFPPKEKWDQNVTIKQALDCLDDYCKSIESLIRKCPGEKKGLKHHRN